MNKKTTFREHARVRVRERLSLTEEEIISILDGGKAITVGREMRSGRLHRAFWSEADQSCFVAVQDEKSNQVITILYPDFDSRCKIPLNVIEELTNGRSAITVPFVEQKQSVGNFQNVRFRVYYESNVKERKSVTLKLPFYDLPVSMEKVQNDPKIQDQLKELILRNKEDGYELNDIFIYLKKKRPPEKFHVKW